MSVVPKLERMQLPDPYKYVLVGSGERKKAFEFLINGGYVAFVERIACDWTEGSDPPATRSILELDIDGVNRKYEYEIQINKPYVFDPPIVARKYIRWWATNNDVPYTAADGSAKNGSHYYGILTDGLLCKQKV